MKHILIIFAAIVILCGLFFGILESIDWDKHRPELAQQLSQQLGAKVELRGRLSISVLPVPQLAAEDAEFESRGLYIRAPSLRLTMQFWPLLAGDVVLKHAEIINPEIRLAPEKWPNAAATDDEHDASVQLQNLTIKNGHLRLQLGKHYETFRSINLKLSAPDWHGPYQTSGDFMRNDIKWKFDSVMGVGNAGGTRPLEINLTKDSDNLLIKWQGAFAPSPLVLQGDGTVEWPNSPPVIWAGEMNLKDDKLDISRSVLAAGDSELGTITGEYDIPGKKWLNLSANLHHIQPHFMAQIPQTERWYGWLKGQRVQTLQFTWQENAYKDFSLSTAILQITKGKDDWLIKGRNAAAMFAEVTGSNAHDWPSALSTPFQLKVVPTGSQVQIKDISFDQTHLSGSLANGKLSLNTDYLSWGSWMNAKAPWRKLLEQNNIREFGVKIKNMDAAPFALNEGEIRLSLQQDGNDVLWHTGGWQLNGKWKDNEFRGQLSCRGKVNLWPLIKNGCVMADVQGDQEIWRFTPPKKLPDGASSFTGDVNFQQDSWQIKTNTLAGQILASGTIGNDDWRLEMNDLSLRALLASRLSSAPEADGKISARLVVINNGARGEVTGKNISLSALNLEATSKLMTNYEIQNQNLRQPGSIGSMKGSLRWLGDDMIFESLQTDLPMGYGKAKINLDKKEWTGEWQGSGPRVTIEGLVNQAVAETRESLMDQKRK